MNRLKISIILFFVLNISLASRNEDEKSFPYAEFYQPSAIVEYGKSEPKLKLLFHYKDFSSFCELTFIKINGEYIYQHDQSIFYKPGCFSILDIAKGKNIFGDDFFSDKSSDELLKEREAKTKLKAELQEKCKIEKDDEINAKNFGELVESILNQPNIVKVTNNNFLENYYTHVDVNAIYKQLLRHIFPDR